MIYLTQSLPRERVVRGDLAVMRAHRRRHLAFGFSSNHVTCSPDMRDGRLQGAIHAYSSRCVNLHAHLLQTKLPRVGAASRSDQELFGSECLVALMMQGREDHSLSRALYAARLL